MDQDFSKTLSEISARIGRIEELILEGGENSDEGFQPEDLEVEWEVTDEKALQTELGLKDIKDLRIATDLVFKRYTHKWRCNFLNQCTTTYSGIAFVINKRNGKTLQNNLMQSATRKDHAIKFWETSPYGYVERNGTDIRFGFGEHRHRSRHISSCANFFGDWGRVSWKWKSTA